MTDEKKPPWDPFHGDSRPLTSKEGWEDTDPIGPLGPLLKGNSGFEHGWWMNATVAGKYFDLCKGTKELPDDEGNMLSCVGCRGCKPELAEEPKIGDYVPTPPVSGVRIK